MRVPAVIIGLLLLFAAARGLASAAPPTSLDISAQRVNFYSNRYVITADGGVRVRLSDGTIVRGETFTMDLKLNRYLIAGAVQLDGTGIHEQGAAFAGYPDLDRSYFLPENATPARWTFYGIDWTNRHAGREQPGDAYSFPDLTGERPYIKASAVRIAPRTDALFDNALIYTAGVYLPQPRYVVTFSANSHYFENAFAGGRFDIGLPFNGSEHSLTALHIRNDPFNGTYLAFDQHFVWPQDYIAFGIDPLTQEERQYNLIAYKRISPKIEARLFAQVSAAQRGLIYEAENSAGFGQLNLTGALSGAGKGTALNYQQNNYYGYLQGLPYGITDLTQPRIDYDPRWQDHPMDATLSLYMTHVRTLVQGPLPVYYSLHTGLRLAHDIYGEAGGYPGDPYLKDDWVHFLGGTLNTRPVNLGKLSLSASYTREKDWFNVNHTQDFAQSRVSLGGAQERQHLRYFVAYEVDNTGDYWGNKQTVVYSPNADFTTTAFGTFGGQAAFRGLATNRAYTSSLIYTPTAFFELAGTLARRYDTPAPVPGLFGQPPWQFSADVRVRVSRQILLDIGREYYFNFADERWTPQFTFQVSP